MIFIFIILFMYFKISKNKILIYLINLNFIVLHLIVFCEGCRPPPPRRPPRAIPPDAVAFALGQPADTLARMHFQPPPVQSLINDCTDCHPCIFLCVSDHCLYMCVCMRARPANCACVTRAGHSLASCYSLFSRSPDNYYIQNAMYIF